jgi:bis(5'-nucleosyl)-tetraphosphatase (symmetrical)
MATYVIGDIQGCFTTLSRLLHRIEFDPGQDRIWLVGDLVNRGPRSLEVLRWARDLGDRLIAVLGNHDLHLLARAEGVRAPKSRDTLDEVLGAPDREALLDWLMSRPLLYRRDPFVLVHAGLLPAWSVHQAERLAAEVQSALDGGMRKDLLRRLFDKKEPLSWDGNLTGLTRFKVIANALTRMRTCTPDGRMCLDFAGPPKLAPAGCVPWYEVTSRASRSATVICGHWAALGLRIQPDVIALDTGCVWGGHLTAFRLDDREVFQEPMADESS